MAWEICYYSAALQREIMDMPPGIQGRYIHLSERMSIYGPDLRMPHTRAMGGGLFELRMKSHEGIGRVFYCTMSKKKIVMLHNFVKKTQKTPVREIAIARRRMKEIKSNDDA